MNNRNINLDLVAQNPSDESLKLEYEFFQNFESTHTRTSYKNDIRHFFQFFSGQFREQSLLNCERFHVVAYKTWLLEGNYSPKSINRKLSSLSAYFKFLMEKSFVETNPCQGIRRPRQVVQKETNDLTDEEVLQLFEAIDKSASPLHKAILYIFFGTGIRKSELINLRKKDLREINGHMTIEVRAKGGKQLLKFLPEECVQAIDDYLAWMDGQERSICDDDWLFQPSKNPYRGKEFLVKPIRPKSIDYIFRKYCQLAGISKHITPHSARATYIGSALDNGSNIIKVAKDVGHSSIKTTEHYNKRRNQLSDSPARNLGFFKKTA